MVIIGFKSTPHQHSAVHNTLPNSPSAFSPDKNEPQPTNGDRLPASPAVVGSTNGNNQTPSHQRRRKKREIRVFVSSTFVDFKDEREVLIKKVFREINRLCLDRGVFFSYVDLRWGITAEQSLDGKTIFICLSEVSLIQWTISRTIASYG